MAIKKDLPVQHLNKQGKKRTKYDAALNKFIRAALQNKSEYFILNRTVLL